MTRLEYEVPLCFSAARKELYRLREDGLRDSERIVDIWILYLSRLAYKLGDEGERH